MGRCAKKNEFLLKNQFMNFENLKILTNSENIIKYGKIGRIGGKWI